MSIPRLTLENYESVTPAVQRAALETAVAEIARLTAQLDRLAAEVKAWRRSWVMIDSQIRDAVASSDSLRSLKRAQLAVDHNNDLGGAK